MASFTKEDEPIIIEKCQAHNATHGRGSGNFTCELKSQTYQLKYGVSHTLATRIATQPALFDETQKVTGIRVPKLVYHFENGGRTYVVMEFVQFTPNPPSNMDEKIEDAIWWLSVFGDDRLGPMGGGCIVHPFFEGGEAPLPFKSVEALRLYIEKGRTRVCGYKTNLQPVSFEKEKLIFVQANIHGSHFGVDTEGNTVIMGIRSMSRLPHSFGRLTLSASENPRFRALPDKFGWSDDSNMKTLQQVAANLKMTADPSLGLDEYGQPTTRKKKVRGAKVAAALQDESKTGE